MLVGVVSDTHNNSRNIENIIAIFNRENVNLVIHTGDITQPSSLRKFSALNCHFCGVLGNNDRNEPGLMDVIKNEKFEFCEPPYLIHVANRKIVIFHEPDDIDDFMLSNKDLDLVLHGHTHRYRNETIGKTLIFNPGESAGILNGKNSVGIINLENLNAQRLFF